MESEDQDFFEETSVGQLADEHADEIAGMQDDEAKKVLKAFQKVRIDLQKRLAYLPQGTFTNQQVTGTLIQVELAIADINKKLKGEMGSSAENIAGTGAEHLVSELHKWNKKFGTPGGFDMDIALVAADAKNLLVNKYDTSIDTYSQALRGTFHQELMNAAIGQLPSTEVVKRLSNVFVGEEWKLNRLVRTELHGIYNFGKLGGMEDLVEDELPDLKKTLWHPMDRRTGKDSIRLSQNNPIVDVDEPFIEDSTGKTLVYMAPPNRPNDRAILIPYRDSWKK